MGFLLFFIWIVISFLVSAFAGKKRYIGFWWSFLFCITFSPLFTYAIIRSSPLKSEPKRITTPTLYNYILLLALLLYLIWTIKDFINRVNTINELTEYKDSLSGMNSNLINETKLADLRTFAFWQFITIFGIMGAIYYQLKTAFIKPKGAIEYKISN